MNKQSNIFDLELEDIISFVNYYGEKNYRARQIYEWIHKNGVMTFDEMTNVSKNLRSKLSENFSLDTLKIKNIQLSKDGSQKFLIESKDENLFESVFIPNCDGRNTACVSTQIGCPMKCSFCATGNCGFVRNLTDQEIYFQLLIIKRQTNQRIDNVVVMGQGEPFLNYHNTLKAIRRINQDDVHKIASRKITVSTCGIIEGIKKFSEEPEQFGLAVSLHSAVQATRRLLMPETKNISLKSLSEALKAYVKKTNRRFTLEYMLFEGINDTEEELRSLVSYCKQMLCHVNLLHYNKVSFCKLVPSRNEKFEKFENVLRSENIACSVRQSKGTDINGACGQLANIISKNEVR